MISAAWNKINNKNGEIRMTFAKTFQIFVFAEVAITRYTVKNIENCESFVNRSEGKRRSKITVIAGKFL